MGKKIELEGYKFTVVDGVITQVFEYHNGYLRLKPAGKGETWSIDGTSFVRTESEHGKTETATYTDTDGDGVFTRTADIKPQQGVTSSTAENYKFDVLDGVVSNAYELVRGNWVTQTPHTGVAYAVQGSDIIKTEQEHGIVETTTYTDADANGLYTRSSKTYALSDGSTVLALDARRHGGDGNDHWQGSRGDDYYYGSQGDDTLAGDDGNDELVGGDGADSLSGGNGADQLYAGAGDDTVDAGAGNDLIIGGDGAGNDIYKGGVGIDTVKYTSAKAGITVDLARCSAGSTAGRDAAGIGSDSLSSIEKVIAGNYDDTIRGDLQANGFTGGLGSDCLYGGRDRVQDMFSYNATAESRPGAARDKIFDFVSKIDRIVLSAIDANTAAAQTGDQAFAFSGKIAKANSVWFKIADVDGNKATSDIVVCGDVDGNTTADFEIGLVGVTSVVAADIAL